MTASFDAREFVSRHFRLRTARKARKSHRPEARRLLRMEPLEPRAMLSASPSLPGWGQPAGALPTVSIVATDATAAEMLPGQTANAGLFTASRTGATAAALTVRYAIVGTATNGTDYARLGTSVVIRAGQSSATVNIVPTDDTLAEGDETVRLTLSSSTAYTIDPARPAATVTIRDNDAPDPKVAAIVGEVQQTNSTAAVDSYQEFFSSLPVNQGAQRGYAQKTAQPDLVAARSTIFAELSAALLPAGGSVRYQEFNVGGYAGKNIVGVLPGQGPHKAQQYLIDAHYDSVQNPGADDDASGVAGLLESALVLAKHKFDATLIFIACDQEEQRSNGWGVGSKFYADSVKASGADLRGATALDMIAYNDSGRNVAVIGQSDSSTSSPSAALVARVGQAFRVYTSLTSQRMTGFDDTNAYRYYQDGFPAATVIEQQARNGNVLNPYYHQASDYYLNASGQPQQYRGRNYLDFVYATQMTKGTVAWAATEALLLDGSAALALPTSLSAIQQAVAASGSANLPWASPAGASSTNRPADATPGVTGQSIPGPQVLPESGARPLAPMPPVDREPTRGAGEDQADVDLAACGLPGKGLKA